MAKIKEKFKIQHISLEEKNKGLLMCTKGWMSIHEADRFLLELHRETTRSEEIITDTPIYLTHTALSQDFGSIGKAPYRYVTLKLGVESFSMGLLCDPTLNIDELNNVI